MQSNSEELTLMPKRTKITINPTLLLSQHLFQVTTINSNLMMMTTTITNSAHLTRKGATTTMTMIKTLKMNLKRKLEIRMISTMMMIKLTKYLVITPDTLQIQEEIVLICSHLMIRIKDIKIYTFRLTMTMMTKIMMVKLFRHGMLMTHNIFCRKRQDLKRIRRKRLDQI